jgi:hypothetical protein
MSPVREVASMGVTIVKGEQWATMVDVISYHHRPLTIEWTL